MKNVVEAVNAMKAQVDGVEEVQFSDFKAEETLLAIIDINNGFAKAGALYSDRVEAKIESIAKLSEKALDAGMKVLAYTDHHPEDAKEFGAYPAHCVGSTIESDLVEELEIQKSKGLIEIHKNSTNGLYAYNPAVSDKHIKNFLVVGCVTDICVYQYALNLRTYLNEFQLEGDVYVSEAQVQTFDIEGFHHGDLMHVTFLKSLMDNGVKVIKDIV